MLTMFSLGLGVDENVVDEYDYEFIKTILSFLMEPSDKGILQENHELPVHLRDGSQIRGGLLGLKDFKMILRVTTAQYCCYGRAAIAHCVFNFLAAEAEPAPEQVKNNQITYMERGREVLLERERES
ncbi:hypothetical protein Tco_1478034, partial [Tanacetum coccineum]